MPGENLTRQEAAARAAVVDVESYDIALDLTLGDRIFGSRTLVEFTATPGATTFIDLIAEVVHEVRLNGRQLDVERWDGARLELPGLAATNELHVVADARYMTTGEGLHRFVDPVDDEVYLYSQFEVADARRVFAVFEQPDLKASFTFTVTAPAHWTVVSNSPTPQPRPSAEDAGAAVWQFAPTPPIPSYITAVVAGPYHRETAELTSSDGRTIPLGVYCRASLAPHLDVENILEVTRQGFAFYEDAFARSYPFEKYDQLFVPEFNAGAMENAGAVTLVESYVFRSQVPQATVERRAVTILHELAHMWFGNLVTMRWWDDLWLNESFAEYMSTWAAAEATRWREAWTTFSALEKSWAYRQDQLPSTHPIVAEIDDLDDVEVNFDGITYAKGASVLAQLVAWVGQDAFVAGVRAYFAKHEWGSTELGDLLTELEATSGRDLRTWSTAWLERAGVTLLRPRLTTDEDGLITSFAIAQEAPETHPVLRPHRLVVGCYDLVGRGVSARLERTRRVELDVDGALTEVPDLLGRPRPDLVLVNDEDLAYAKVRLDEQSLRTAVDHLARFEDSLARALVWSAAWDMTRDGELPARDFVDLVLTNIGAETDSTVLLVLLRRLSLTLSAYTAPEHRETVLPQVADRLWQLTREAAPGSDAQLQLVRSYAATAYTAAQLDTVAALLDGSPELAGLVVDADLRWALVTALAATDRIDLAGISAQERRDPTAAGRQAAARARAARPSAAAKREAWEAVVATDELPNALQAAVIAGFSRARDRSVLLPYVERYFTALERVWQQRTNEMAQNLVTGLYPFKLAGLTDLGVDVLARTDQWLASHPDAAPALRRLVVEDRDAVRRAVAAQQVDRAARGA